jgi:uncharacterized protein YlzI (FlbEa/FlbD family)
MIHRSIRRLPVVVGAVALLSGMLAPGVLAAGPEHVGPFTFDYTMDFPEFCAEAGRPMHVQWHTQGWSAYTVWADENGDVTKVIDRERAPFDTVTNLDTGRQIVVRGEFQEIIERIPGTDDFTKTITGFRYLINEPGAGVVAQEVGRIVYGDLEQTIALWQAGKHDLVYDQDFVLLCDLLDQPA